MSTAHQATRDPIAQAYDALIARLVRWAQDQEDVRAVIVLGSRGRTDQPADEWSDLDVSLFVHDPGRYLSNADWVQVLDRPWVSFVERTADGSGWERRVLFEGGLDVDLVLIPVDRVEQMARQGISVDSADPIRRGVRVLLDKDRLLEGLAALPGPEPIRPPSQVEFLQLVNDFWYHTVWTAKKLRRGELWTAKSCADNYMKWRLLSLIEWHARATKGWDLDTWHQGRFLEQWADPRIVKQLHDAFAHYEESDVWRALWATMDLFRWVAGETAARLGYEYPAAAEEYSTELVRELAEKCWPGPPSLE